MISVGTVLTRAANVLNDTSNTRWTVPELTSWFNEACKAIVTRKPEAGAITANFVLIDGTKQSLAPNAYKLLDISRNIIDAAPGRVVKRVDRQLMDNSNPDWHTKTPSAEVRNYIYDDTINAIDFWVYPPAIAGNTVLSTISYFPAEITSQQDFVEMPNEYEEAILNYVLFRSFSKDSEYANANTAAGHYAAFQASLGEQPK